MVIKQVVVNQGLVVLPISGTWNTICYVWSWSESKMGEFLNASHISDSVFPTEEAWYKCESLIWNGLFVFSAVLFFYLMLYVNGTSTLKEAFKYFQPSPIFRAVKVWDSAFEYYETAIHSLSRDLRDCPNYAEFKTKISSWASISNALS